MDFAVELDIVDSVVDLHTADSAAEPDTADSAVESHMTDLAVVAAGKTVEMENMFVPERAGLLAWLTFHCCSLRPCRQHQ